MKQTALEWLMDKFLSAGYSTPNAWKKQAKEMEKEQIVDAWSDGWLNDYEYDKDVKNSAEQYYNETFKSNE